MGFGTSDAVAIGSAITVIISVVIVAFLWFKVKGLMDKDAHNRKD
jgi:hypothetical protein